MSKPPTDVERLRFFLSLVEHYESACERLPIPSAFVVGGPPHDPVDQENLRLRAVLMRKFVRGNDVVHVRNVIRSLLREMGDDEHDQRAKEWWNGEEADLVGGAKYITTDGDTSPGEVSVDLLYGVLLHGDYEKWRRASRIEGSLLEQHALAYWLQVAEAILMGVVKMIRDEEAARNISLSA